MSSWVIFTDLDGTLLDRRTYSPEAAQPALRNLQELDVPVVFCSSKTRAEQRYHQQQLGVRHPCIVENGSAIVVPAGYFSRAPANGRTLDDGDTVIELGMDAETVQAKLARIRNLTGLAFQGYSEISDDELHDWTGLSGAAVQRARQREYSETIRSGFSTSDWSMFQQFLTDEGVQCVSGGELFTVTSIHANKGVAARQLADLYRQDRDPVCILGIGDSPNDRAMLAEMDVACQVARPDGTWIDMQLPGIRQFGVGPVGWSEAVADILNCQIR